MLWIVLLGLLFEPKSLGIATLLFAKFCLSFIGFAGFGFLLNDICDVEADARAGKTNASASLSASAKGGLIAALLALGVMPWFFLPTNVFNIGGLAAQVVLLVIYPMPPVRLKDRGFAGVVADALYGHVLPAWIAAFTFMSIETLERHWPLWTVGVAWLLAHGLRNILLHQIDDRHNDRVAGATTFVTLHDAVRIYQGISFFISPLEFLLLSLFAVGLIHVVPATLPLLAIYLILDSLRCNRHPGGSKNARYYRRRYRMNAFRATWLPLMALIQLTLMHWRFALWLICYPIVFPQAVPVISLRIRIALRSVRRRIKDSGPLVNAIIVARSSKDDVAMTPFSRKIKKALAYLAYIQGPNGQFPIYCSNDDEMKTGAIDHTSVFATAVIAHALLDVRAANDIINHSARFLQSEEHDHGVWKYFTKADPRSSTMPPDVDDTAMVSVVLRHLGYPVAASENRILAQRDKHGRFPTWILDRNGTPDDPTPPSLEQYDKFWIVTTARNDDVDAVVNANVLHFLGRRDETAGAIKWLAEQQNLLDVTDKWYLDGPERCWGFGRVTDLLGDSCNLVRHMRGYVRTEIGSYDTKRPAMFWAMLGATAIDLRLESALIRTCANHVARSQRWDGSWPRAAFYYSSPNREFVWGGDSISTAICAAFLDRVERQAGL